MAFWDRWLGRKSGSIGSSLELFRQVYGGRESRSGKTVTPQTAVEVTAVLACCRVIADGLAQVPFKIYRADGDVRLPATDHPLYRLLYRAPNAWQTSFEFRETLAFHLVLTGNAYVFVNRIGIKREVRSLEPIEPGRVVVKRAADGTMTYEVRGDNGASTVFPAGSIWHLRGPSWNSWMGLDATRLARDAIGLSMSLEQGQAEFLKNGAQTSGVLSIKPKMSPEQFNFLAAWLDKHLPGGERYGKPLIADSEAEFTPMSMTNVDAQTVELRRLQIEEVCRAFRVMPIMVGATDKTATYASAEQMFLAHVIHTLSPWYERIEHSADVNLLSDADIAAGLYTKFTANALMRGAASDRATYFAKALGAGGSPAWMTQDEVRGLEELNPLGGDAAKLPVATNVAPTPTGA